MLQDRINAGMIAFVSMLPAFAPASAQDYPRKPVRIVTAEAGGTGDLVARFIATGIAGQLGQPVIVENCGGQNVPQGLVARAAPDGYTLLSYSTGMWITPLIQTVSYDPIKDFYPITFAGSAPNILVVYPSVPAKTVSELIAYARARPGVLNYAAGLSGSSSLLWAELFNYMAGTKLAHPVQRQRLDPVAVLLTAASIRAAKAYDAQAGICLSFTRTVGAMLAREETLC